jgi:cytoskeletal protein RodZ
MDIGAQLRTAREAKGLSIGTVSQRTRVPARALSAIERNDRTALPPPPFSRGFVRTYAKEVDLDPDSMVRAYFAQFPEQAVAAPAISVREVPDTSWQEPSRFVGMAAALAILIAVVVTAVVLGRRSETGAEPVAVGTTGESAATPAPAVTTPSAAPARERPATAPGTTPAQPVPTGAITVVLAMSRPCWVAATVDGQRTIYKVVQAGETATLAGNNAIAIRFGDAGAVKWTINGRDPGAVGGNGAVRDVRVTPDNAATVR